MWVKILKSVVVNRQPQPAGVEIEVSKKDADLLIGLGKAEAIVKAAPEPVKKVTRRRKPKTVKED